MLNSGHIQKKLENSLKLQRMTLECNKPATAIDNLYLVILSRHPTEEEMQTMLAYGNVAFSQAPEPEGNTAKKQKRKERLKKNKPNVNKEQMKGWTDIAWALINSPEFLYRH
jgi:hypothetical protein